MFKCALVDIGGVLLDATSTALPGAIEALNKLSNLLTVVLCSNTCQIPSVTLKETLQNAGFNLEGIAVYTAADAGLAHVLDNNMTNIHALVTQELEESWIKAGISVNSSVDCDCLILGDAGDRITYTSINEAYRSLIKCKKLVALSGATCYVKKGNLFLDVAPFTSLLKSAVPDCDVTVVGKPSAEFFMHAMRMGSCQDPKEAVMIGDDLESDIGGAQACGINGIHVSSGKHVGKTCVVPTYRAKSMEEAVDHIYYIST